MTLVVSKVALKFALLRCLWYNMPMDKNNVFATDFPVTHGRGYVYSLQYHIVWCTKYRKKIFCGDIGNEVADYLKETAHALQMNIVAMEVMPDHIHILADCKPQLRLSDAIKVLKGNTARWLFLKHPELKKQLWGGHLWNPSYFVATVSDRSKEQVLHYIENQKS